MKDLITARFRGKKSSCLCSFVFHPLFHCCQIYKYIYIHICGGYKKNFLLKLSEQQLKIKKGEEWVLIRSLDTKEGVSSGVIKYDLPTKRLVGSIKLWLLFICLFFNFYFLINVIRGSHGAAHSVALFQNVKAKTSSWKYFKYYMSKMRQTEDEQGSTSVCGLYHLRP